MLCPPHRLIGALFWIAAFLSLAAACAPAAPPAPASAPPPAPTVAAPAPAATAPPAVAAPTTKPAVKPAGPSEWVIALNEEPSTLDPAWASQGVARQIWMHIFDSLLNFEGMDFHATPMLAESWKVTGNTTWDFKLRRGIKFHNGDEFTANDVKYSFDLYKLEKSQNRSFLAEVTSVEVVDQQNIRISTRGPAASLLYNLSRLPIMPREAREKAGDDAFARKPVGTGPYKAVDFVRGQRIVLEANPTYWRGQISPGKLTLRPILDPSTRVAELKSGGVHIIVAPAVPRLKELQEGDTQLMPLKSARLIMYPFNTTEKPFDDVRVRQAVNYAIDREAIIKNVLEGYGVPLHGPFSPGWLGYDPDLKPYPHDPTKARQLLVEAGYPSGFEAVFNITQGVFLKDREIAEAMASQLAQVGIKVQLVLTERAKITADWQNGVFKGITSANWATGPDPDAMIGTALYKRKMHKPDDKLNGLIDQSRREVDQEQRTRILREFGRYVHEQAYWIFSHAQDEFYAKRKDVPWEHYPTASYGSLAFYRVPSR